MIYKEKIEILPKIEFIGPDFHCLHLLKKLVILTEDGPQKCPKFIGGGKK
ncbi:MAG: hypothetical protein ACP5OB_08575 [Candidatus Ratteibacteria bacterium]